MRRHIQHRCEQPIVAVPCAAAPPDWVPNALRGQCAATALEAEPDPIMLLIPPAPPPCCPALTCDKTHPLKPN